MLKTFLLFSFMVLISKWVLQNKKVSIYKNLKEIQRKSFVNKIIFVKRIKRKRKKCLVKTKYLTRQLQYSIDPSPM